MKRGFKGVITGADVVLNNFTKTFHFIFMDVYFVFFFYILFCQRTLTLTSQLDRVDSFEFSIMANFFVGGKSGSFQVARKDSCALPRVA